MGRPKGQHWLQVDPLWAGREWRVPALDKSLARLTKELQKRERGEAKNSKAVLNALDAFSREVRHVADRPTRPRHKSYGSMFDAGCHLVSLANVLRHLGVKFNGRELDPLRLVRVMQEKLLLTLTGYSDAPGVDPLHILTRGKVVLSSYEDFGARGAPMSASKILRQGLGRGKCAVVNVWSHEYLGRMSYCHYVVVTKRLRGDWYMLDPDDGECNSLLQHYQRVFAVWLYRKASKRRR